MVDRTRKGSRYVYYPCMLDAGAAHLRGLVPGTIVRTMQPHGCPKNNTMKHSYIESQGGRFWGLVANASLHEVEEYKRFRNLNSERNLPEVIP